jgi:hypothetical protein
VASQLRHQLRHQRLGTTSRTSGSGQKFPTHFLKNKEFAAEEKLEIVIGAAEPRFAGGLPRPELVEGRKSFERFSKYSKFKTGRTPVLNLTDDPLGR